MVPGPVEMIWARRVAKKTQTLHSPQVGSKAEKDFPNRGRHQYINLCGFKDEGGIPRGVTGANTAYAFGAAPILTMNWAAGLSFSRCHAEWNVPVDWHLRFMFTGEEISRAVRFFSHGYDMYSPTDLTIVHNYTAAGQKFWKYSEPAVTANSQKRVKQFLTDGRLVDFNDGTDTSWLGTGSTEFGGPGGRNISTVHGPGSDAPPPPYYLGLGGQRSLKDYVLWSHVNLLGNDERWTKLLQENGFNRESHNFCLNLPRSPVRDEVALLASVAKRHRSPRGELPVHFGSDAKITFQDNAKHSFELVKETLTGADTVNDR